jgi:acylglycerol lipase
MLIKLQIFVAPFVKVSRYETIHKIAPALRPFNPPNFLIEFVATYLSFLYPTYTQPNNLKIEKLASDPAVVDAYLKDPFNHDRITLQLAGFILGAGSKWLKNPKAFKGPIFLYHSSKDEFTCYNSSKKFMDSIGSTDATFMTLESEFHELHNELGDTKWTIANDYVKWMLDRSKIRSKL